LSEKYLRGFREGSEELFFGRIEGDDVVVCEDRFESAFKEKGGHFPLSEVAFWSMPVFPSKLVAFGVNYRAHADETGHVPPSSPIAFLKSNTSLCGHEQFTPYPASLTQHVDYEAELCAIVGKKLYKAGEDEARAAIAGLTCAIDYSARDIQKRDGQWMLAKSFEGFTPMGPYLVTGLDPDDLSIRLRRNGELRQDSRTSQMIFGVPCLLSFLSQVMPLYPGDAILTGTPEGVGPVKPGDVIEVEIEGIGILRNRIVSENFLSEL
jgi:2-keto-4-pentenoate hydratase/2-oxohepta-3-ene-1,7-dioic acid hydratase in catechol pathway